MINRYAGEIHINPIRILRNDDFNNDGQIKDIQETLKQAVQINKEITGRLERLHQWLVKENILTAVQFRFADGGYISISGLADAQLKKLAADGLIELFDFATDKDWVKRHGQRFGLIWEDGRAVEL